MLAKPKVILKLKRVFLTCFWMFALQFRTVNYKKAQPQHHITTENWPVLSSFRFKNGSQRLATGPTPSLPQVEMDTSSLLQYEFF